MRKVARVLSLVLALTLVTPFLNPAQATVASGVGVVTNGLVFDFDAANPNGGSGTAMTNLVTSNSAVSGTLQSGVTRSSLNGNTYVFDGTSSSYATVSIGATDFSSGFSLSFYAKFLSPVANDHTFERVIDFANAAATTGDANYSMWVGRYLDTNDLSIEVWNGTTRPGNCRAIGAIQPGVFAHYAVTVNGSTCTFYLNKVAQTTTYLGSGYINPPAITRSSAFIGKSNWVDDYFKGEIGEIAMYNSVLSQSDINQNFNSQTDVTPPTYTGASTFSPNENQSAVSTLTGGEAVTFLEYTTSGNYNVFSVTSGGVLTFDSPPNYESPNPSNTLYYYFYIIDLNGNAALNVVTINVQDVAEFATLTSPSLSAAPYKGIFVTITVTPTVAAGSPAGKVTYLVAGKRIPGCYKKLFTSGNSTCTWKPPSMGFEEVTVSYTPANTEYAVATVKKSFLVFKRTNLR
ncbi:MAG: LamG domain-containing protein [Candidatus Planktophila sp.]